MTTDYMLMAWLRYHHTYSRSKIPSTYNRSTSPLPTSIKSVARMSSMKSLKRDGEIVQISLNPLLGFTSGEKRLYVLILLDVFVYRAFSGTPSVVAGTLTSVD